MRKQTSKAIRYGGRVLGRRSNSTTPRSFRFRIGSWYPLPILLFFFYAFHFLLNSLIFIIIVWLIFRCSKRCFSEGLPRPLPSSSDNKVIFIPLQISPHIYLYVFVELKLAIDYFCIYVFMYYSGSLCAWLIYSPQISSHSDVVY